MALLTSCSSRTDGGGRGQDSVPAVAAGPTVADPRALPVSPPAGAAAPRDSVRAVPVTWDLPQLVTALGQAGVAPVGAARTIRQPFMSVPATLLTLPKAQLQAFIYGDAVALGRDVARLDTVRVAPPTTMITWVMPPSLVVSNNLAAIVLTRDSMTRHRVTDAITLRHDPH